MIGEYSALYSAYLVQLETVMVWLVGIGLALGLGWEILPAVYQGKRLRLVEMVYTFAFLGVSAFLAWRMV